MEDFLVSMAASVILSVLKLAIKNPEQAAALRAVMIKIHDQIEVLYGFTEANP